MNQNIPTTGLKRVPDLWFEDGSLIFQADNQIFRVHGNTLASQSPVFRDMLSFPQPHPSEIIEDCLLVHLPDPAIEVTHFFRSIFVPNYFAPPPVPTNLEILLSILRLSHKYDVSSLRRCALCHLATAYPTTLEGWDGRCETRTFPSIIKFDDEFQLLQVALKLNAQWAMPTLFYTCGAYPMHEILRSPAWIEAGDLLIEKDQCLLGYVEQFAASLRVLRFLVQPVTNGCLTPLLCYPNRLTWFDIVDNWRASIPLDIWDESDWKRFAKDVCPVCFNQSKLVHRNARLSVWKNLPRTYKLPPWEDLEAQKAVALG